LSLLSACGGEVRPFLIIEKGDNEGVRKQTSFLGREGFALLHFLPFLKIEA
jgi:hypothetical protein